jgi:hypothetical protein
MDQEEAGCQGTQDCPKAVDGIESGHSARRSVDGTHPQAGQDRKGPPHENRRDQKGRSGQKQTQEMGERTRREGGSSEGYIEIGSPIDDLKEKGAVEADADFQPSIELEPVLRPVCLPPQEVISQGQPPINVPRTMVVAAVVLPMIKDKYLAQTSS